MKFDFGRYKDCKVVMHCKTKEEAEDFCKEMDIYGLNWNDGKRYIKDNRWDVCTNSMCYNFIAGDYAPNYYYQTRGFQILEWSDFMNKNKFTKSDLKDGDICVLRNGTLYIAVPGTNILIGKCDECNLNFYNNELRYNKCNEKDIVDVFRPTKSEHCTLQSWAYKYGDHVYHIDKIRLAKKEIAEKFGVDVSDLEIVE